MAYPWVKKFAVIAISAAITLGLLFACLGVAGSAMGVLTGQQAPGHFARWSLSITPCILAVVVYARWRTRRLQRQQKAQKQAQRAASAQATPPHLMPHQPPTLAERRKSLQNP